MASREAKTVARLLSHLQSFTAETSIDRREWERAYMYK